MATSETDIRQAVALLLHKYGSLDTTQVKKLLPTVMPFDSDDMQMSNTRNEYLILQRIGNIVSHQKEKIKNYFDIYIIDKNYSPAQWSLLTGMQSTGTLQPISGIELQKKQSKTFAPRIIDWEQVNSRRTELGFQGECFAFRFETNRVINFAPLDTARIIHLSVEQGDGAGFDIISLNEDGSDRYIEVKTTEGDWQTPFYMTSNEIEFFQLHMEDNNAFIYRVYNFNRITQTGFIQVISAQELYQNYNFDPISYKVSLK